MLGQRKPLAPALRHTSRSAQPCSCQRSSCGTTSSCMKRRTLSRNVSCSGENSVRGIMRHNIAAMNKPVESLGKLAALTGAEAVVEMLKAHGVEVVFGLCGDTSLPLYDAFYNSKKIKHVLTRDERHAAYMADGYARVTGKVGVCEGPSGGGATYILPGLVEANESSIPVLA